MGSILNEQWSRVEDMNNGTEMGSALMQLRQFRWYGIAVMTLMHHRKSGGEHGQQVAGSAAIVGEADMAFTVERVDDCTRRLVTLRTKKGSPQPPYYVAEQGGRLTRVEASAAMKESAVSQNKDRVLDVIIAGGPTGVLVREIQTALEMKEETLRRRITDLLKVEAIRKLKDPNDPRRFRYVANTPDEVITLTNVRRGRNPD